ncbi:MAG: hypothetical protein AB1806_08415 [Acidobacteriota bacterium]
MALRDHRMAAARLIVCLALAVIHTWPLALAPDRLSRHDNADTMLNEWIVAWVVHQAPRDPAALFDANIFYPERRTLAFSEHLVVQSAMAAPMIWLGASPVLAYNLLLMLGLALSAWAMWVTMERWTGSDAAGAAAGSLLAFNAHTLTRLPHVQALHLEFLPLAWLALDSLLRRPHLRTAIALGLLAAAQALTSNYQLVFTALALVVSVAVRPREWACPHSRRTLGFLLLAGAVATMLVGPSLVPYYLARQEQGLTRSIEEVALYSSTWRDYVATAGRLHYAWWSHRFLEGATALFPGFAALLLAGVALGSMRVRRDPRARMCTITGGVGLVLSFGPAVPGYAWLYASIPLLQGVRGAARFGFLMLVAVAVLGGFGVSVLRARWGGRTWWPIAAGLLVVVLNVEALRAPLAYRPFDGVPGVYDVLANEPHAIVAEFPFFRPDAVFRNASYVLNSTAHWRKLVNGYSGFTPASYVRHAERLRDFPGDNSRSLLDELGVTHVVVHFAEYGEHAERMRSAVAAAGWLRTMAAQRDLTIYEVDRRR